MLIGAAVLALLGAPVVVIPLLLLELVAPLWEEVAVAPIPRLLPKVSVVLLPRGMRVVVLLPLGVGAVLLLLPVVVVLVVLPAELPPL
jgi:hypothetical protein